VNANLIFAGAETGLFVTVDGGANWTQLKGGLPTAQFRDITIQKRETDLVMGTFGRGFYVLDDYSALREITPQTLAREAQLYPLRHAYSFIRGGSANPGSAGIGPLSGNWATPNPPVGAWMTYSVGSASIPATSRLVLTITNNAGMQIRRCELDKTPGLKRFAWNLNADPGIAFNANNQPIQGGAPAGGRGGQGGGRGGAGGADSAAVTPTTPPAAPTIQSCTPAAGAGGGFGGGRGGGGGAARVPNGFYRAQIGWMIGSTVTPIGPSQTFEVKALLTPQPW
jgi:hypothetical protein